RLKLKALHIRDTPLDSALSLSASAERRKYLHGQTKNLPLRNKLKRRRRADNHHNENRRHSALRCNDLRTCKQSAAEIEIETGWKFTGQNQRIVRKYRRTKYLGKGRIINDKAAACGKDMGIGERNALKN
ncbi:MAG: hypothetical protein KBS54_02570, partial [Synergistaceae bacterium]|nr:hypothetical protein [Candidatus Equadaptatus faecalis]